MVSITFHRDLKWLLECQGRRNFFRQLCQKAKTQYLDVLKFLFSSEQSNIILFLTVYTLA